MKTGCPKYWISRTFLCVFVKWRENKEMKQNKGLLTFCEYVPILSMPDTRVKDILCQIPVEKTF